ncbi:hypothetical protein GGF46_004041 [Coemansia sp. RSA 552]|nr:hypothetical protein GGF46_004041 [Coemansia sp. RSA 552]
MAPQSPHEQQQQPAAAGDDGAGSSRRHHQHHRHHSRHRHDGRRRSSRISVSRTEDAEGGNSSDGCFSESGSTSCSTASSYSVDYPAPRGRGRRHRHHRKTSIQNIPVSRHSTGRRVQVAIDAGDDDTGNGSNNGSSGSSEDAIEQPDEDGSNVRARQEALNTRHPFGLPIWKPALYKKSRSVTRAAFLALHARPLRSAALYLKPGNIAWLLLAGWWLMAICFVIAAILFVVPSGGRYYARVAGGLGWYLLWPFGRYVERIKDNAHDLDSCSITPTTDGASALDPNDDDDDDEAAPLLSGQSTPGAVPGSRAALRHAHFQHQTVLGRGVYYTLLVLILNPLLIFVSALAWFAVFSIPMGKLTHTLARYLWRDPLSLHFRSGDLPTVKVAAPEAAGDAPQTIEEPAPTVLLCTNEAVGWYYYKYTVDGVNILMYNMLALAIFVLVAAFGIAPLTDHQHALVQPGVLFPMCLVSTIPLAYFIGQAVSSISAQSSLGMGAVINATFGSIVEVILYSIALTQGKARLVEGALVGSLIAGLMLMPGTSMIAGGVKHKVQRFNAKSAEVTATLVIMSIIGAFAPTLFYHTFAVPEFECRDDEGGVRHCRQTNVDFLDDPFYQETVKPFMYFCTAILPLAYLIALWFSLKTHVKHIYSSPPQTSNPILRHVLELFRRAVGPDGPGHRNSQRVHRSRAEQAGSTVAGSAQPVSAPALTVNNAPPEQEHLGGDALEPTSPGAVSPRQQSSARLSRSPSYYHGHHRPSASYNPADAPSSMPNVPRLSELPRVLAADPDDQLPDLALLERVAADGVAAAGEGSSGGHGGHDAPNWSKAKSAFILCSCTVIFSLVAEVLVDTVDVVIQGVGIPEKYIGLTLFALVPNVTEFMNAIAFAIQNNIALSIEISNAYTVQVALLQIPILVFFSAFYGVPDFVGHTDGLRALATRWMSAPSALRAAGGSTEGQLPTDPSAYVFALLFPRWDLIATLFCVFLLTYMLIEGKANYFKGSILCLSYLVWLVSFAFEPIAAHGSD